VYLEKIKKRLLSGREIEDIVENFDWKQFEEIIEEVFDTNGFKVHRNFRFKTKKRYEMDLIAVKNEKALCVDCKKWRGGRNKKGGLKVAAGKQKERARQFLKFLKNNPIAQAKLGLKSEFSAYPLIVTLLQEDLVEEDGVFFIPLWKLNLFLIEIEKYLNF